jgi:hypothetical protein
MFQQNMIFNLWLKDANDVVRAIRVMRTLVDGQAQTARLSKKFRQPGIATAGGQDRSENGNPRTVCLPVHKIAASFRGKFPSLISRRCSGVYPVQTGRHWHSVQIGRHRPSPV